MRTPSPPPHSADPGLSRSGDDRPSGAAPTGAAPASAPAQLADASARAARDPDSDASAARDPDSDASAARDSDSSVMRDANFNASAARDPDSARAAREHAAWQACIDARLAELGIAGTSAGPDANLSPAPGAAPTDAPPSQSVHVLCIGAGIVNLLSAYELARAGYRVTIIEAGPDPRTRPDWRHTGATMGGANARMFSLGEADHFREKLALSPTALSAMVHRSVADGGWLLTQTRPPPLTASAPGMPTRVPAGGAQAGHKDTPDRAAQRWLTRFETMPRWRAHAYRRDLYRFNRHSQVLWQRLQAAHPALFRAAGYQAGLISVYTDHAALAHSIPQQQALGALKRVLSQDELAAQYPAFTAACAGGELAGGLELTGFTVAIHDFIARLVDHLEASGAGLIWRTRVERLLRAPGASGAITGVASGDHHWHADHYVISPGGYGYELLRDTRCEQTLHGVLGLWLTLPNHSPALTRGCKIRRDPGGVTADINIICSPDHSGRPTMLIGAGFAFVGQRAPDQCDPAEFEPMYREIEDTIARLLPRHCQTGPLERLSRACIRPFTSTGLGLFDVLPAHGGGRVVITGGHNTGGFTQAPAVAEAVLATVRGQRHPMQTLYAPDRGDETTDDFGRVARLAAQPSVSPKRGIANPK